MVKRALKGDPEHLALAAQFARYGMVGIGVTIVGVSAYWLLATPLGVAPLLANLFAYVISAAIGYGLHSRFSFRGHGRRDNLSRTGGRFMIVSFVSFGLNSLWVWIATGLFDGPTWWPVPAMVFVTPVIVFILNRKWVFGS